MSRISSAALLLLLLITTPLSAREANEQYRQLLAAVTYHGITIGDPRERALSKEGGFEPFFLGMNACTRKDLGVPFHPDTELMLITSVHTGQVIGMEYTIPSEIAADLAPLDALRSKIEAIYRITLPLDAEGTEQDRVFLRWSTRRAEGEKPVRVLTIYDIQLHDELRPATPPEKK